MTCNLCGGGARQFLWNVKGYKIFRCPTCDLIYADVSRENLRNAYESDYYRKIYPGYETDRNVHNMNNKVILDAIEGFSKGGKLLEIGSAFGFFLKSAEDRGWHVVGFETSNYASTVAREKFGLDVRNADFLTQPVEGQYDFVCLLDTLEHLTDPSSVIQKIVGILSPKGGIIITTADINSFPSRLFGKRWRMIAPPFHIYYYTLKTLSHLLTKHGLTIVSVKYSGKYQNLGSILQYSLGISKARFPVIPIYVNLRDIMTVIARIRA